MFLPNAKYGENQWYQYLLSLLIILIAWQVIGAIPYMIYIIIKNISSIQDGQLLTQELLLPHTNFELALFLLSFIIGLIAIFFCIKYIHHRPILSVITSRKKIDFKRILLGITIWGALTLIILGISIATAEPGQIALQFDPSRFAGLMLVSLLLLPFQTSFEEIFFRGYLMQACYLFFKQNKWMALIATSIIFGLMHAINPEIKAFGFWIAMPQYVLMGLILGYVTLKDGGLELAIGLHTANNILIALLVTSDSSTLQTAALFRDMAPSMSYMNSLSILTCGVIFIYVCKKRLNWRISMCTTQKLSAK